MNALWHYWHPVSWSKEVTDKPVPVKLLDQPLVIWRANDKLAAFYDLCLHRGAALSLGWLNGDQLVCAYHGWNTPQTAVARAFRRCHRIARYPTRRAQKRFRVQERYGLVSGLPRRTLSGYSRSAAESLGCVA